ncbi:hypothetical protein GCM10010389_33130 [Streptomyces echinoruber]|uniref:Uncharacterized protein n=1 Tax=Streptomyces echinoruber TaxID=68898 RepID=A0A918VDZ0_9ACTN|nr:hypothetical protein GCM10010389_33130 [Streptomyces echinoruber]
MAVSSASRVPVTSYTNSTPPCRHPVPPGRGTFPAGRAGGCGAVGHAAAKAVASPCGAAPQWDSNTLTHWGSWSTGRWQPQRASAVITTDRGHYDQSPNNHSTGPTVGAGRGRQCQGPLPGLR